MFTAMGRLRGALPFVYIFDNPHISDTIRARMLKFYAHLRRVKCCVPV